MGPKTDRTYKFFIRSPISSWFLMRTARLPRGPEKDVIMGNVTLKEVYHMARAKSMDPQLIGQPLRVICLGLHRTARALGVTITKDILPEFSKRTDTPIEQLENLRKELRLKNKASKKAGKK